MNGNEPIKREWWYGTRSVFPSYLAYSYNRKLNPLRKSLLNLMRQLKRMLGLCTVKRRVCRGSVFNQRITAISLHCIVGQLVESISYIVVLVGRLW